VLKGKALVAVCALVMAGGNLAALADSLLFSYRNGQPNDAIRRWELSSGAVSDLYVFGQNVSVEPLALDGAHGQLYFGIIGGKISRINLDGSGKVDLVSGSWYPEGLALDLAGGKMYWTDTLNDKIWRANLDGSNVQDIITSGLLQATGLAMDPVTQRIYWTDYHRDVIGSAKLDGTDMRVFATPGGGASQIVIDQINRKLIWSDFDSYKIYRSNLDGSAIETIVSSSGPAGSSLPGTLAIDEARRQLYWMDYGMNKIRRSNLQGQNIVDIYSGPGVRGFSGLAFVPEPGSIGVMVFGVVLLARRGRGRKVGSRAG
jgi:sugar lactone lactonase YvrE